MSAHTVIGAELLAKSNIAQLKLAEEIARCHHEWWDGTGYPAGLRGDEIPLGARILAVVDAFESMTQGRVHRAPISRQTALNEIVRLAGRQFDPDVVDAIERVLPRLELDVAARSPVDAPSGAATRR